MVLLTGIYNPKGVDVPDPIQTICTRWGGDPFSYGSYSHVRVQSSGNDYDILAENVGGRLFFAGEATTRQYPATMHGAFLSGLREASRILSANRSQQNNSRKSLPKNLAINNDTLIGLFKWPDLTFGNFSFISNPLTEDPNSMGIMRVTFDSCGDDLKEELENSFQRPLNLPLQLYTVLSREQAESLQLVTGGDDIKLSHLSRNLGLKLMGPTALANFGSSLISIIASSRKGRGRNRVTSGKI